MSFKRQVVASKGNWKCPHCRAAMVNPIARTHEGKLFTPGDRRELTDKGFIQRVCINCGGMATLYDPRTFVSIAGANEHHSECHWRRSDGSRIHNFQWVSGIAKRKAAWHTRRLVRSLISCKYSPEAISEIIGVSVRRVRKIARELVQEAKR